MILTAATMCLVGFGIWTPWVLFGLPFLFILDLSLMMIWGDQ